MVMTILSLRENHGKMSRDVFHLLLAKQSKEHGGNRAVNVDSHNIECEALT